MPARYANSDELWSWKANRETGIAVIQGKQYISTAYLNKLQPGAGTNGAGMPTLTVANVTFKAGTIRTPNQLEEIKLYNGGHFWSMNNAGQWVHVKINGDYTEKVCQQI